MIKTNQFSLSTLQIKYDKDLQSQVNLEILNLKV